MGAPLSNCRWTLHVDARGEYRVRELIGTPGNEQVLEFHGIEDRAAATDLVRQRVALVETTMGGFVQLLGRHVAESTERAN